MGDPSGIGPEVVAKALQTRALYDNMRVAHAREPFEGERLTLVAMSEAYTGSEDLRQTG